MKNISTNTIIFILIAITSISISMIVSYLATINSFFPIEKWLKQRVNIIISSISSYNSPLTNYSGIVSTIGGVKGDVKPIQIYKTNIIPKIKDYYDIISASVKIH